MAVKPKKRSRSRPQRTQFDRQMAIRLSEEDYSLLAEAAGPYPIATWARVELVRLAREKLGKKGG